jgi:magnesium-transporting ATPase (P-type)
MSVLVRSS